MVDACEILAVSRNTLKKLIREGTLPAFTIRGVAGYRLRRHEVQALMRRVLIASLRKKKARGTASGVKPRAR